MDVFSDQLYGVSSTEEDYQNNGKNNSITICTFCSLFLIISKISLNFLKNWSLLFCLSSIIQNIPSHCHRVTLCMRGCDIYGDIYIWRYIYIYLCFLLTSRLSVASLRRILEITNISDNSYLKKGFFC